MRLFVINLDSQGEIRPSSGPPIKTSFLVRRKLFLYCFDFLEVISLSIRGRKVEWL